MVDEGGMQPKSNSIATSNPADSYGQPRGFALVEPAGAEWMTPGHAMAYATEMYGRTLSAWAMDVLALRRKGLDTPRQPKPTKAADWHAMCVLTGTRRDASGQP